MKQIQNSAFACLPLLLFGFLPPSGPQEGDVWTQAELEAMSATIQKDVEAIRGESFKRPVSVELIDGPGFIEYAKGRMQEMSTPELQSAEEDIYKMLGLVPAEMDLMQATMKLLEGQVGGFYDPAGDIFYLMEAFTGGVAKVILAHELTHALDDQLYDLDAGFSTRLKNRDALAAYQSVVEGSGTAVMAVWTMKNIGALDPKDLEQAQSMGVDSLADAPEVLWKPLMASYVTGQTFLQKGYRFLKKTDKDASIADATNKAFEKPPLSMEQVLHPEKYWDPKKRDDPKRVSLAIEGTDGWELLDRSVLGELQLALITREPEPVDFTNQMALAFLKYTNPAAEGWGGDQTLLYGKGDARRLVITTVWDTKEDSAEFAEAMQARLESWRKKVQKLDPEWIGSGVDVVVSSMSNPAVTIDIWYGCEKP